MHPGPNLIKLFKAVIYEFCNKLVFVPGKPFQLRLLFVGKARTYPIQVQQANTKGGSITVPLTSCLTGLD
jgi:hypothetical protein